jgi:hypothetical protein
MQIALNGQDWCEGLGVVSAPFSSTKRALEFFFGEAPGGIARPMMSRLAAPAVGAGSGLSGVDGAHQAGRIGQKLVACGPLYEAVLTVQFAPERMPCSCGNRCCSGFELNRRRQEALDYVSQAALVPLAGCVSHYRLRRGLVERAFGRDVTLSELVDLCNVSRGLASDHNAKIVAWLKGVRKGVGKPMTVGVIDLAFQAVDERLRAAGIVGVRF